MDGMEKLDKETREKILEFSGRNCAKAHALDTFRKIGGNAENIDEALELLNREFGKEIYSKTGDNTVKVTYPRCYCPLVGLGLVNSPHQCNCSVAWIKENFEAILNKKVTITPVTTILRGGDKCQFIITL